MSLILAKSIMHYHHFELLEDLFVTLLCYGPARNCKSILVLLVEDFLCT